MQKMHKYPSTCIVTLLVLLETRRYGALLLSRAAQLREVEIVELVKFEPASWMAWIIAEEQRARRRRARSK